MEKSESLSLSIKLREGVMLVMNNKFLIHLPDFETTNPLFEKLKVLVGEGNYFYACQLIESNPNQYSNLSDAEVTLKSVIVGLEKFSTKDRRSIRSAYEDFSIPLHFCLNSVWKCKLEMLIILVRIFIRDWYGLENHLDMLMTVAQNLAGKSPAADKLDEEILDLTNFMPIRPNPTNMKRFLEYLDKKKAEGRLRINDYDFNIFIGNIKPPPSIEIIFV